LQSTASVLTPHHKANRDGEPKAENEGVEWKNNPQEEGIPPSRPLHLSSLPLGFASLLLVPLHAVAFSQRDPLFVSSRIPLLLPFNGFALQLCSRTHIRGTVHRATPVMYTAPPLAATSSSSNAANTRYHRFASFFFFLFSF
jgi:hypothetical protein